MPLRHLLPRLFGGTSFMGGGELELLGALLNGWQGRGWRVGQTVLVRNRARNKILPIHDQFMIILLNS